MNGFLLSVLVLVALPCALGLQCYKCTPKISTSGVEGCDQALSNTTDLANCTKIGLGVAYDACVTTAIMLKTKLGGKTVSVYTMACGVQKACSKLETDTCGKKYPGFEVTKCGVACCNTPMCNTRDRVKPKAVDSNGLGTTKSASIVFNGIMLVLGFVLSA